MRDKEHNNSQPQGEPDYRPLSKLIDLLHSFRSFIREYDFTLENFNLYLSTDERDHIEYIYRTANSATSYEAPLNSTQPDITAFTSTASHYEKIAYLSYIKSKQKSTSDAEDAMKDSYKKFLKTGDFSNFLKEVFDSFKVAHSYDMKALLSLKEATDEGRFNQVTVRPPSFIDAVKKSELEKNLAIENSENSKEKNSPKKLAYTQKKEEVKEKSQHTEPSPIIIDFLIDSLNSFKEFIKVDDFTFMNFKLYLSATDRNQFEHTYRTTHTGTLHKAAYSPSGDEIKKILLAASHEDIKHFFNFIELRKESASVLLENMKDSYRKFIEEPDFEIFAEEFFDFFKESYLKSLEALLVLRNTMDKDIFDKIMTGPQCLIDAIRESEAEEYLITHDSENNKPLQEVFAQATMGTKAQAEVAADTTTTPTDTLATSAIPVVDSDANPISYAMPLLIASASAGAVAYAWQQGWLTDDMADNPVVDIVAAVIGFDPFH